MTWYKSSQMRWHYEHGLMIHSALEVAKEYAKDEIVRWAYSMYDPFIASDGSIATYRQGEYNLDQINAGRVLFALMTTARRSASCWRRTSSSAS